MKLIDLLVQELPKRGGWPDGAESVVQDADDSEFYFFTGGPVKNGGKSWWFVDSDNRNDNSKWIFFEGRNDIADDCNSAIVTREQYESALAAKNDGWIDWGGGECPLKNGTKVDVKDRDGYEHLGEIIGYNNNVDSIFWRHGGVGCPDNEIIAYRLHQPQEAEQTEADDEADLNECIGQDVAPVWNGEGLTPPVGCECERSWAGDEWQSCKILFTSDQIVVVKLKGSGMEDAYNIGGVTFRPLRTESEKKRDAAVEAMQREADEGDNWIYSEYEIIFDAIAAGKIPGVKLED